MVAGERGGYASRLASGHLSYHFINKILPFFEQHFKILPVQPDVISGFKPELSIDTTLSRHPLYVVLGHKVWSGLVVGFPGNIEELSTTHVSTPYLRKILYPLLNLHQHLQKTSPDPLRCLYLIGDRFSDVFLRKFRLLELITPHIVVLTGDLAKAKTKPADPAQLTAFNEAWAQAWLSQKLQSPDGLDIPTSDGRSVRGGFIANELSTGEGTRNPERLDILAYDRADKSLIAFEIKGPGCSRTELENLFLQGSEHRNWLEANKLAVKFFFDGPYSNRINTRKRVRLVLGFFQEQVPPLYYALRAEALQKDRHLKIDFVQLKGSPQTGLDLKIIT